MTTTVRENIYNQPKARAYVLDMPDAPMELVTFHTAYLDKGRTAQVTFWSPFNVWASITATKLGIQYSFMRNATNEEAARCIRQQKLKVKGIKEL